MIVVTGAAGFIASCLINKLNQEGFKSIIAVDDFSKKEKLHNLQGKDISILLDRNDFINWFSENANQIEFVFHLGARSKTTELSVETLDKLNLEYSKSIWKICAQYQIPLIYASSAATYGLGEIGYDDNKSTIPQLKPLNLYAHSKQDFDLWVLSQNNTPPFWYGLKFFNVYGPNEYHKGNMSSVILTAYKQIKETGMMKLFQSHKEDIPDGHQMRDFVYVKDVLRVCHWLMNHKKDSGIYNLGSGKARTFLDLVKSTFKSMSVEENIDFIPTPTQIRNSYQYFTEAKMDKLKSIGYPYPFTELEDGVDDYINNYLESDKYM
jgi:ADP-L-glycero-D-manno-heptose 6-epimerase